MNTRKSSSALAAAVALSLSALCAAPALADINIGVTLSATGPAASLGIPEKNTFELLPTTIGGEKINWIVLDDASDTTRAVHQHAQAHRGEQGRRDRRLDDHAELARDGRRRRGRRDADDLDGGVARASSIRPTRRRAGCSRRRRATR